MYRKIILSGQQNSLVRNFAWQYHNCNNCSYLMLWWKKDSWLTCSGSSDNLLHVPIPSGTENSRSMDTLVSGIGRYLFPSWANSGQHAYTATHTNLLFGPTFYHAHTFQPVLVALRIAAGLWAYQSLSTVLTWKKLFQELSLLRTCLGCLVSVVLNYCSASV